MITPERLAELKALCEKEEACSPFVDPPYAFSTIRNALPELIGEIESLRTRHAELLRLAEDAVDIATQLTRWEHEMDDTAELKRRLDAVKGTPCTPY